jgi:hypothetical protein
MCVQTKNQPWERPAVAEDIPILRSHFPGIDFAGMLEAMSVDGCVPLATDLVLFAGILSVEPDKRGVRYVPFAGIDLDNPTAPTVVKIPEMNGIVEWMENTALGTYMWKQASNWSEKHYGCRVEFSMDCGCGGVRPEQYANGEWRNWVRAFNKSRRHAYGRTNIEHHQTIHGTDINLDQLFMWRRMRAALKALPVVVHNEELALVGAAV